MSNYKYLYLKLFNAITDAIKILEKAQAETKEDYLKLCKKEEAENMLFNINVFRDK